MSVIKKAKVKIPTTDKTRDKFLSIAIEIGCVDIVTRLMKKYNKIYLRYMHDPLSCSRLAENMLNELANIDIRLVGWLFNDANEIRVNNKVVMKLVDDGK